MPRLPCQGVLVTKSLSFLVLARCISQVPRCMCCTEYVGTKTVVDQVSVKHLLSSFLQSCSTWIAVRMSPALVPVATPHLHEPLSPIIMQARGAQRSGGNIAKVAERPQLRSISGSLTGQGQIRLYFSFCFRRPSPPEIPRTVCLVA